MITLKKIDSNNVWEVLKLTVGDEQKKFVSTNTNSIIEAYVTNIEENAGNIALPFGIYNEDVLIGFVMFGYGTTGESDEPNIAEGNYTIWRFMIDKTYQGKGYGKEALKVSLNYLRTFPCGHAELCWLGYAPENIVAKSLYSSVGFKENGEMNGADIVATLRLC